VEAQIGFEVDSMPAPSSISSFPLLCIPRLKVRLNLAPESPPGKPATSALVWPRAHRPKSHQTHLEWPPSRMLNWAAKVGINTAQPVERMLEGNPHPGMGYRACLGIIRLAQKYSPARMEAAAERAVLIGAISYKSVKSILRNGLDSQPPPLPPAPRPSPEHENLRGPEYFQ
jgi:hypothetical protein